MKNKKMIIVIVILGILVLVCAGALYRHYAPSSEKREMTEQYDIQQGQYLLVINDTVLDARGVASEGQPYIPVELASQYFNHRFFWDKEENILSYATPTELLTVGLASKNYMVGREQKSAKYNVLIQQGEQIYISMDFVKTYSACQFKTYTNPSRIVAVGDFTTKYQFATMKKSTRLRVGANKKYAYLLEIEEDAAVYLDKDAKAENEYVKVMTTDGIEGYVPEDSFSGKEERAMTTDYVEPQYEHQSIGKTVSMGWHQVTNEASNNYLTDTLAATKGVNVVSPTWFSLSNNKGEFTSLASTSYVQAAHSRGVQVWALVSDFKKKVSMTKLMGRTSARQQLVNNLVAKAIQYDIDGINIDFEQITADSAGGYLEFLRELMIKCKSNNLIVSVDNYMPASHNTHYDLAEQGKVVDYVVMMGYDEHYPGGGESGSVSSISFVQNGLTNVLALVPANQVVMGMPFYTRLWKEVAKSDGTVKITSEAYGMDGAEAMLKRNGAMAKWDSTTGQYYAEFKSGKSTTYKIWMEEEKSLEEKLKVITAQNIAGTAYWKLGLERSAAWDVIAKYIK